MKNILHVMRVILTLIHPLQMIHRDLAARNVLLTHEGIVKICDFGLAREFSRYDEYIRKQNIPLPVKWMAPESILDRLFTSKSDVWSYGVLLWEIFSLGATPFAGQEINSQFVSNLVNGIRLDKPKYCPETIFESVLLDCWKMEPIDRPDFSQISKFLDTFIKSTDREFYLELDQQYTHVNYYNQFDYLEMKF